MVTLYRILKEHVLHANQIRRLAKIDLIKTYKGSALNWLWSIIKPSMMIFVYWFAFEYGLRISRPVEEYPLFLWLIAGVIPWFYMSDVLTKCTDSIKKYSYLVTKLRFPISVIPTFVNLSKLYVHFLLVAILIIIFWLSGYPPDVYLLQLPIYMLLMFTFFSIWSLFASCIASLSRDFSHLVRAAVTPIFWLSGIIWNPENIPIEWIKKVLLFNPITFIVNGFRNVFIYKTYIFEQSNRLFYFEIVTLVILLLALWIYKRTHKEIPDVL